MKYFVTVNGEEHEVELVERLGQVEVRYDGAPVPVRYQEVDALGQVGMYLEDQSFAVSIEGNSTAASVTVAGRLYEVDIEDERERAARRAERERGGRGGAIKSVMPGVVVQLLVAQGDEVVDGQPLLILEAMKMQNEIAAPCAGTIASIHIAEKQAVAAGEKLLTIDAPAEPAE